SPASTRTARPSRAGTSTNRPPMRPSGCRPAECRSIAPARARAMPEGAGGGRMDFPFVGIPSFLRSRIVADPGGPEADVAVLGAPTDEGSPFMPGSRFGPRSIREHSLRFLTDTPGYFDPQDERRYLEREMASDRIADVGDADVLPTNVEDTFANITSM